MPGRTLSPWNQSIVWACDGLASPGSNAPVEVSSTMIMHSFSILNKELTLPYCDLPTADLGPFCPLKKYVNLDILSQRQKCKLGFAL